MVVACLNQGPRWHCLPSSLVVCSLLSLNGHLQVVTEDLLCLELKVRRDVGQRRLPESQRYSFEREVGGIPGYLTAARAGLSACVLHRFSRASSGSSVPKQTSLGSMRSHP